MAYLVHPDKLAAAQNVVLKRKAKRPSQSRSSRASTTPGTQAAGGNMLLRLAQQMYVNRQNKINGSL